MAKGKAPVKTVKQKTVPIGSTTKPTKSFSTGNKTIRFFSNIRIQILLIVVITLGFYGNSINNDFAFDDGEFYTANKFVQKGVDGIYDLFTKESMYGFYGHATPASGTCWRPLTLISFALEKEFSDSDPHVSHFTNVLLLIITGVIMLLFLRKYIFKTLPLASFMVVLLFIIHPVHTEAVSHIKSRDELLSWLFLLLTMYCSLNFLSNRNYWQLFLSFIFYFLSLLSKEYGVSFIAILPLTFYFFTNEKPRAIILTSLSFVVVFCIYALVRFSYVPIISNITTDIVFRPYLYATPIQRLATELMALGKYILLLFWPNPLTTDYSYRQVPYVTFTDWRVWLSIIIQAALVFYALLKIKEKNIVSYGILFYFCSIFIVSNILIDTDSVIGERFLYQPSFGFCLAIVAVAYELLQKIKFKNKSQEFSIPFSLIAAVILLSGFQTIQRNTEWAGSRVLANADIRKSPNSLLAHENHGNDFIADARIATTLQQRHECFLNALKEFDTAITLLPTYPITWVNIGYTYLQLDSNDKAKSAYLKSIEVDSSYPRGYSGLGSIYFNEKNYEKALVYFKKSVQLDSLDALDYGNLGASYHMMGQLENAVVYYKKALRLDPTLQDPKQNLANAETLLKNKK